MTERSALRHGLVGLALTCITACQEPAKPKPGASSSNIEPGVSASAAVAPAASAKTEKENKKPRSKAAAATSDEALGTLPADTGLAVGKKIPSVEVSDRLGKSVQLATLHEDRPLLLVFYRGGWCPFCNYQLRSLARSIKEFEKRDLQLAVLSVDRPDAAARTQASWEIPFPVLSDPKLVAHKAFRVLQEVDDKTVSGLKSRGMDLEAHSGQSHHTIAVPAIFLIDKSGTVRWAHADRDYKTRPTTTQLLGALDLVDPVKSTLQARDARKVGADNVPPTKKP